MAAAPGISIVIPTLNCARNLTVALRSIRAQHYPADRVEIIVADGGSTDATRETAESWGCTLVDNPLVTGEAGKAAGLARAAHEIVGFVDSDNELTSPRFLQAVADALADPQIAGAEPIEFAALDTMPALDRYFALLGMNDPLVLFLGTYDRLCRVTGKWTGVDHVVVEECPTYRKVQFRRAKMPTVGAMGSLRGGQSPPPLFATDISSMSISSTPALPARSSMWPSFIWESRTTTRNRCVSSPASKGAERKTSSISRLRASGSAHRRVGVPWYSPPPR